MEHGDELEVIVQAPDNLDFSTVHLQIRYVSEEFDIFKGSYPCKYRLTPGKVRITHTIVTDFIPGLYYVSEIIFSKEGQGIPIATDNPPHFTLPFTVINRDEVIDESISPADRYTQILAMRENIRNEGIGCLSGEAGVNHYRALVWIMGIMISQDIDILRYRLIRLGGLGCLDIVASMNEVLVNFQLRPLNESDQERLMINARHDKPCMLALMPNVFAHDLKKASEIILNEAMLLCNIMSFGRSASGQPFAMLVLEMNTGQGAYQILSSNYKGNLLPGFLAGESPDQIKSRLDRARGNDKIKLILNSFREALAEENVFFQYFRYWNLIEMMARWRKYIGQPLLDWSGNPVLNRRKIPRVIQDNAEDIVGEHIRQVFLAKKISKTFINAGQQHTDVINMIPIWYRRRNCVAHRGSCIPADVSVCDPMSKKHQVCNQALNEVIKLNNDVYLEALRLTVGQCVLYEFLNII